MLTEEVNEVEIQIPDEVADAWAEVLIDLYEKLKARGELPGDGACANDELAKVRSQPFERRVSTNGTVSRN